jgi:SAM-dependent methyltransferase
MFKNKYLKYKNKYLQIKLLQLKIQIQNGGGYIWIYKDTPTRDEIKIINSPLNLISTLRTDQKDIEKIYQDSIWNNNKQKIKNINSNTLIIHNLGKEDEKILYRNKEIIRKEVSNYYKYYNPAMVVFGIDICIKSLHTFLQSYKSKDIIKLSIGSGSGILEYEYNKLFLTEQPLICIDPNPLSFNSSGLVEPFKKPKYKTIDDFITKNTTFVNYNSVLVINWPDPKANYDIEAIRKLNPLAFFVIFYKKKDDDIYVDKSVADVPGVAGSIELQNLIKDIQEKSNNSYKIIREIYTKKYNFCIGWYQSFCFSDTNLIIDDIPEIVDLDKDPYSL